MANFIKGSNDKGINTVSLTVRIPNIDTLASFPENSIEFAYL